MQCIGVIFEKWTVLVSWFLLRSFTLKDPKGIGSNIGVVLYQRAFYVTKGNAEKSQQLMKKDLYPTGGINVPWEQDVKQM